MRGLSSSSRRGEDLSILPLRRLSAELIAEASFSFLLKETLPLSRPIFPMLLRWKRRMGVSCFPSFPSTRIEPFLLSSSIVFPSRYSEKGRYALPLFSITNCRSLPFYCPLDFPIIQMTRFFFLLLLLLDSPLASPLQKKNWPPPPLPLSRRGEISFPSSSLLAELLAEFAPFPFSLFPNSSKRPLLPLLSPAFF